MCITNLGIEMQVDPSLQMFTGRGLLGAGNVEAMTQATKKG